MKISELQELLQKAKEEYGDIAVVTDVMEEQGKVRKYVMGGSVLYLEIGEVR